MEVFAIPYTTTGDAQIDKVINKKAMVNTLAKDKPPSITFSSANLKSKLAVPSTYCAAEQACRSAGLANKGGKTRERLRAKLAARQVATQRKP